MPINPSGNKDAAVDPCPHCGALSYRGGYCFSCGKYRPAKRATGSKSEDPDAAEFMQESPEARLGTLLLTEDELERWRKEGEMHERYYPRGFFKKYPQVVITETNATQATLLVRAVVEPYGTAPEGSLIQSVSSPWRAIVRHLQNDWSNASKIPPYIWEEMIAAAFDEDGYDQVVLTPRSGDYGRDVIATKNGVGSIRIIGSVKAYKPGHLVKHDDVRALAGVLAGDPKASKGILSTTSDFAPGIATDPFLAPFMPYRLELMNGAILRKWLSDLAK